MESPFLRKFKSFIDYINTGCDEHTNRFIEKKYKRMTTASVIYPILDRDKPFSCIGCLLMVLIYTTWIGYINYIAFKSSIMLFEISLGLFVHITHIMVLLQMSIVILWHSWLKRSNTATLHRIIAQNFFEYGEDHSETWQLLRSGMTIQKKRYTECVLLIGVATGLVIVVGPAVNKLGTFQINATAHDLNFDLAIPLTHPFTSTDTSYVYAQYFVIILTALIFSLIVCTKCFMVIECLLHIDMQLRLLKHKIENIEERAVKLYKQLYGDRPKHQKPCLYSNEFSQCYSICLIKTIKHHKIIIKALEELNSVFGFYAFLYYLSATVNIAMSMLATTSTKELPGTSLAAVIMCIVEVLFVGLFSHMGQRLTDLGTDLRDVIYNMPWYYCNEEVKSTVRVLQLAMLKPISFSFYSILRMNNDSFATVLNSAYSYYNLVTASHK